MKTKLLFAFLFVTILSHAQETPQQKIEKITMEIEIKVKNEKGSLKSKLEHIDEQLKNGEITEPEAISLKKTVSVSSAEEISDLINEMTDQIIEYSNEIAKNAIESETTLIIDTLPENKEVAKIEINIKKNKDIKAKLLETRFLMAFGLNNVINDGKLSSLDDTPYTVWNSNFFEIGLNNKQSLSKRSNLLNLVYGVSFQWNELKLYDNLYHVDIDDQTLVVTHPEDLKKSKLRNSSIIVPLGLEFDFSGTKDVNGVKIPQRNKSVRIGIGGYGGLRINTKQIIKYDAPRDQKKEKIVSNYNMNNLIYGLTGYLGYKDASLYVKYDLNPLFKDTETSNISLGVRFDL
jgi:hypothetical protein